MGKEQNITDTLNNSDVLLQAFGNTDISVFMYYPQEKRIQVPKKVCDKYQCQPEYANMPETLRDAFVLPDDYPVFMESYAKIDRGEKSSTCQFHSKDKSLYWRVTLTVLNWKEDQPAQEVLGIIEDISEWDKDKQLIELIQSQLAQASADGDEMTEARRLISAAIGNQYYALYHIWMEDRTYICYQEQLPGILSVIGERGFYEPAWDKYINNYIEPEDRPEMRRFAEFSTLAQRLQNKRTITHEYRRKNVGWTRGQFIVAKRDRKGRATNVVYTVVDINAEKNLELAQRKALYDAQHDPLTGVMNRKAFEDAIAAKQNKNRPLGLLIVDIDNFKMINDHHGHDMGDKILKSTAQTMQSAFRSGDVIFRIGGDEFCVLLTNCDASAWETLCGKQQKIHAACAEEFPDIPVTLSCGICFSENGYSEELFRNADEALYETKQTGRAGCTLLDAATGRKTSWHDNRLSSQTQNLLSMSDTGIYRFEFFPNGEQEPRLICGEVAKSIFGFPQDISAEDCFRLWMAGLDTFYLETLQHAAGKALQGKLTECYYRWKHPKFGPIFMRSGGRGETVGNMQVIYGYHHSMRETEIIENDDEKCMLDAVSGSYFCSYYIDIDQNSFVIMKDARREELLNMRLDHAAETLTQAVHVLAHPDDRERLMKFTDFSTLPDRLRQENHVDCEYMSLSEKRWCRASFFPVKRNSQGRVNKVLYMVAPLDAHNAEEFKTVVRSKKSIESLYNNVPGGIVLYEWTGKELKTLRMSRYYGDMFGYSVEDSPGKPDFSRIHPDDLADYEKAFLHAINVTHRLEYSYRIWNKKRSCYVWVKIDAVSEPQPDGTSLIYAVFTDVTEQKVAEQRLKKSNASIMAALGAAEQFSYEYDPVEHTSTCFTDDNMGYNLDHVIRNYPECFRTNDFMNPADVELFIDTVHQIDNGADRSYCVIRVQKNHRWHWHSCTFEAFYDMEKERRVALLTVVDVTPQMTAMRAYESRMQMLARANKNALCMCDINLTQNRFSNVKAKSVIKRVGEQAHTLDEFMLLASEQVFDDRERQQYLSLFNRENLLARFERGENQISLEHYYRISPNHTEWVETVFDLVEDPTSGDVMGICYAKSRNRSKLSRILLDAALERDYPMAALVYADTGEYYLYEIDRGQYCQHKLGYWDKIHEQLDETSDGNELAKIKANLTREKVVSHLQSHREYSYAFYGLYRGERCRLEARFRYADQEHNLVIATLRNITDEALYRQYKFESEHDPLTGLLNRNTLFRRCRQLINEHPEEQFVMLHGDIKHFHLYNTFFGEKGGDRLLCHIADRFREIEHDYDYWAFGRIEADVFCAFFPLREDVLKKHAHYLLEEIPKTRNDFMIEAAVGIYLVKDPSMTMEAMFTRATIAAKSGNKHFQGLISVYDDSMEQTLADSQQVISEMQVALEQEQFHVYLQPKYSLRTEQLAGAEALVRWIHPEKGMIFPGKFIPVFERNGYISTLDRYMWEHVCRILRGWQDSGHPMCPISVNVSRVSMYIQSTVSFLIDLVKRYELDPKYLELELTETAYMDDPEELKRMLRELKEFGFTILMDDFGSGYSSLNTLRELPVDVLKLDMKFLSETRNDSRGIAVLSSVVRMSKLLNLPIVAEGVEKREQADYLRSIGCEYAQGFLFARPMPVTEFEQLTADTEYEEHDGEEDEVLQPEGRQSLIEGKNEPIGLLEYSEGKFAYLQTNTRFLSEFDLLENLKPASKIFRDHMDDRNYALLLQAFAYCAESKEEALIRIRWQGDDGGLRDYEGHVFYAGRIGSYASLVVTFLNLTQIKRIGFDSENGQY